MLNGPVFEFCLNNGQPDYLNTEQMDAILFSYAMVWYMNGTERSPIFASLVGGY